MNDPLALKPDEKAIIIDRDQSVLYTDYESTGRPLKKLHLLDVIDSRDVQILRLISVAVDRPGAFAEGEVIFRTERKRVPVIYGADHRTHIIFSR